MYFKISSQKRLEDQQQQQLPTNGTALRSTALVYDGAGVCPVLLSWWGVICGVGDGV